MPELTFVSRWPDGQRRTHYSPSLVVHDYLIAGQAYEVADFVARTDEALQLASDRVQARHGFPCSAAAATRAGIHAAARDCPDGSVTVESFQPVRVAS